MIVVILEITLHFVCLFMFFVLQCDKEFIRYHDALELLIFWRWL